MSKTEYDSKQAHVELAARMRARDAGTIRHVYWMEYLMSIGSAPNVGDRVPYVIIQGLKGAKNYEKAEDPIFVLENNIALDTKYYLENQLQQPLLRIFEPLLDNPQSMFSMYLVDDSFTYVTAGDHTRAVTQVASSHGALSRFTVKKLQCLSCKTPLTGSGM